jgi:hypothetical protein
LKKLIDAVDETLEILWEDTAGAVGDEVEFDQSTDDLILEGRRLVEDLERGADRPLDEQRDLFAYTSEVLLRALMVVTHEERYDDVIKVTKLTIRAYEAYGEVIGDEESPAPFRGVIPLLRMKRLAAEYEKKLAKLRAPNPSGRQSTDIKTTTRRNGLVVLLWSASPVDWERVLFDKELKNLRQLQREFREELTVHDVPAAGRGDLVNSILEYEPDIVHFSGHGDRNNDTGEYTLIFHGADDKGDEASLEEILGVFQLARESEQGRRLRCVVLNACMTSEIASALSDIVDCVLGTPTEVGDDAALAFAQDFYEKLCFAQSIAFAHRSGIQAMKRAEPEFGDVPALFTRGDVDPREIQFVTKHRHRA